MGRTFHNGERRDRRFNKDGDFREQARRKKHSTREAVIQQQFLAEEDQKQTPKK